MRPRLVSRLIVLPLLLAVPLGSSRLRSAADGPYRLSASMRLGVQTLAHVFDSRSGRLYATTFSSPRGVVVVETAVRRTARKIEGAPYGYIDVAPDLNELYVLSPVESRLRVVDLGTRQIVRTYPIQPGVGVFYESGRRELYVFGANNRRTAVIDAQTGQPRATIALAGDPTFVVSDPGLQRVYIRLSKRDAVQVIDAVEHATVATWPVDAHGPSTMAIDPVSQRLFVAAVDELWMLDSRTGEVSARLSVPHMGRVLALACDPATRLVMAATPQGLIVARVEGASLTLVQNLSVALSTRALFLNPATHALFTIVQAQTGSADVTLPATSELLVFEYR